MGYGSLRPMAMSMSGAVNAVQFGQHILRHRFQLEILEFIVVARLDA